MHDFDQIYLRNSEAFREHSFIFENCFCPKSVGFCTRPSVRDFCQIFQIFREQMNFFCKCLQFLLHILSKSVRHRYRLASSSKWKSPLRYEQVTNEIWMRICIISTRFRSDFFKKSYLSKYFTFSFQNLLARLRKLGKLAHIMRGGEI